MLITNYAVYNLNEPMHVNSFIDPTTYVPATMSPIHLAGTLIILHPVLAGTSHTSMPAKVLVFYMLSFLSKPYIYFAEVEFDLAESSNVEPHVHIVELFLLISVGLLLLNILVLILLTI